MPAGSPRAGRTIETPATPDLMLKSLHAEERGIPFWVNTRFQGLATGYFSWDYSRKSYAHFGGE
jgi:23S rRNA G2069 N7-methylase RlmK/C1962 C5-methylase RlmI